MQGLFSRLFSKWTSFRTRVNAGHWLLNSMHDIGKIQKFAHDVFTRTRTIFSNALSSVRPDGGRFNLDAVNSRLAGTRDAASSYIDDLRQLRRTFTRGVADDIKGEVRGILDGAEYLHTQVLHHLNHLGAPGGPYRATNTRSRIRTLPRPRRAAFLLLRSSRRVYATADRMMQRLNEYARKHKKLKGIAFDKAMLPVTIAGLRSLEAALAKLIADCKKILEEQQKAGIPAPIHSSPNHSDAA